MSNSVKQILEEAAKDVLTPETLTAIEKSFNEAVEARVDAAVKAALIKQDNDYAVKLEQLMEAVDNDASTKTIMLVSKLKAQQAKQIAKIRKEVMAEAAQFKNTLVKNLSDYLDIELKNAIPDKMIAEAVQNTRAHQFLTNLKGALAIDEAVVNDTIRSAVLDGKEKIEEATRNATLAAARLDEANKQLAETKAQLVLEQKLATLPKEQRAYVGKVLQGKDAKYITENFDTTVKICEKEEARAREALRVEAAKSTQATTVDRVQKVVNESAPAQADKEVSQYLKFM